MDLTKMVSFVGMSASYESRKVSRNEFSWGFISTAGVSDGHQPYETAVCHNGYTHNGERSGMCIVEAYSTIEEAKLGHKKWLKIMQDNPPEKLIDCKNAGIVDLLIDDEIVFMRESI